MVIFIESQATCPLFKLIQNCKVEAVNKDDCGWGSISMHPCILAFQSRTLKFKQVTCLILDVNSCGYVASIGTYIG